LVRPNQGLIQPGGSESVQILLVEKDKNSLLQSYNRLGQAALDHSKDKFLVQSCVVSADFVRDYNSSTDDAYDKLSGLWASITSSAAHTIANKKLHVRHTVSATEAEIPVASGGGGVEMPPKHVVAGNVQDMTNDQLLNEVTNLRRKYDELVNFSVNLTAERDILNNTLEQTKRDLNRELAKTKTLPTNVRSSPHAPNAKSSNGGGRGNLVVTILVAVLFFALGSRMEAAGATTGLKKLPVLGSLLQGRTKPVSSKPNKSKSNGGSTKSSSRDRQPDQEL